MKRLVRNFRIVLVLSIIGSGYMLLNTLVCGLCYDMLNQMKEPMLEAFPQMKVSYEMMMAIPQICYILMALLYALSLTGVILMYRLKRNGWHCYTLAQLLLLLVPVLFMGRTAFGIGDLMLTILFSTYYFITLRSIEKLQAMEEGNTPSEPEKTNHTEE